LKYQYAGSSDNIVINKMLPFVKTNTMAGISKEFLYGFQSSNMGSRDGKATHTSRKQSLTSRKVFVEDTTTGYQLETIIPEGHYSKKEMQKLTQVALDELTEKLMKMRKQANK
jgi:hypothetical protein